MVNKTKCVPGMIAVHTTVSFEPVQKQFKFFNRFKCHPGLEFSRKCSSRSFYTTGILKVIIFLSGFFLDHFSGVRGALTFTWPSVVCSIGNSNLF